MHGQRDSIRFLCSPNQQAIVFAPPHCIYVSYINIRCTASGVNAVWTGPAFVPEKWHFNVHAVNLDANCGPMETMERFALRGSTYRERRKGGHKEDSGSIGRFWSRSQRSHYPPASLSVFVNTTSLIGYYYEVVCAETEGGRGSTLSRKPWHIIP